MVHGQAVDAPTPYFQQRTLSYDVLLHCAFGFVPARHLSERDGARSPKCQRDQFEPAN